MEEAEWLERNIFINYAERSFYPKLYMISIFLALLDVVEKYGIWRVRDGNQIHVYEDKWRPYQNGHKIWSPKPSNYDIMFVSELTH